MDKGVNNRFETFEVEVKGKPMTTEQLLQYKNKHDERQEQLLEQLSGQAKQIKQGQYLIKDELNTQEPLLSKLNDNMDRLQNKMDRSNNMLANYLEKSTDKCLYWTIGIELGLLFLFFML